MEFTQRELDRMDFVDNIIHNMFEILFECELDWDIEKIGLVRDITWELMAGEKIMTEMEFYPYTGVEYER